MVLAGNVLGGGGVGGALQTIEVKRLASDGTFDFTNITQKYNHLKLFMVLRSDRIAKKDSIKCLPNNDTGNNYDRLNYMFTATAHASGGNIATNAGHIGDCAADQAIANMFDITEAWIADYAATDKYKVLKALSSTHQSSALADIYGYGAVTWWLSTAAITRLVIIPWNGTNYRAGSVASLYGII